MPRRSGGEAGPESRGARQSRPPGKTLAPSLTPFQSGCLLLALGLALASVAPPAAGAAEGSGGGGPAPGIAVRQARDVGGLEARSAALVLSGQQGGDLPASLLVMPLPGPGEGRVRLLLVLDLDGATLRTAALETASGRGGAGESPEPGAEGASESRVVEVHAYALDGEDLLRAHFNQAFVLDAPAEDAGEPWAGVKFLGFMDVVPGEYSVRVLARERRSGRLALRTAVVTAPGPGQPLPPSVLFPESPRRWTVIRRSAAGRSASEGVPGIAFPLAREALPGPGRAGGGEGSATGAVTAAQGPSRIVPSTRPLVGPEGGGFWLLGGSATEAGETWSALLERSDGRRIPLPDLRPGPVVTIPPPDGGPALPVRRVPAPAAGGAPLLGGLPPGGHLLEITAPGGAVGAIPLVVLSEGLERTLEAALGSTLRTRVGGPEAPLWTDLLELSGREGEGSPRRAETAATPSGEGASPERLARFQAGYLAALASLAEAAWDDVSEAVTELERGGLAAGIASQDLAQGQLQVARDLRDAGDPGSGASAATSGALLPLIHLHGEAYRRHREAGRFLLAAHSRRLVEGLVELYLGQDGAGEGAEPGQGEERRRLGASALVSLAGYLVQHGNSLEAAPLLHRALELEEGHAVARLTLAQIYELVGEHGESIRQLEALLATAAEAASAAGPEIAAARLRLGVQLLRSGKEEDGRRHLEACRGDSAPRWVRQVAGQELAALALEQGRGEEALTLLQGALERWPGHQRFHLQLAATLEALGRHAEARQLVEHLERRLRRGSVWGSARGPAGSRDSARLRYTEWPAGGLEESRRHLEERARAELPSLVAAVEKLTGPGAAGGGPVDPIGEPSP